MTQNKLAEVSSAGTALFILEILQAQQYFVRDRMQSKFFLFMLVVNISLQKALLHVI